jgi:hypothetical protein
VLSQVDVAVRVLVIDDCSPDNTQQVGEELAASDPRVEFRRHPVNKGHIATYNEGIDWASSDYLLILSADDYLLPGALSRSAALMQAHPEVGFVFGDAVEAERQGTRTQPNSSVGGSWEVLTGMEFIDRNGTQNIVRTPTAVIRTELQKRVGGYRPELPHSGDMEMWLRLAAYASVGIVPSIQAVYRRHECNMSLAYGAEGSLPDIKQRKVALDLFFEACSSQLPDAERLRQRMFQSLSCDALGLASSALNTGQTKIAERLTEWALQLCPDVRKSFLWAKLSWKRRIPGPVLRMLHPASIGLRQLKSSMKARQLAG